MVATSGQQEKSRRCPPKPVGVRSQTYDISARIDEATLEHEGRVKCSTGSIMASAGVVAVEYYNGSAVKKYTREGTSTKSSGSGDLVQKCQRFFSSTFLPEGYPASVTSDYLCE